MSGVTRRRFLVESCRIGAGVAALATGAYAAGAGLLAGEASAATGLRPPAPADVQTFVSRPDIRCAGVSVATTVDVGDLPSYVFMGTRAASGSSLPVGVDRGLMICDLDGELVWWQQMDGEGLDPSNFRVQEYRGEPVLTWWQGVIGPGYSTSGSYVIADATYREILGFTASDYPSDAHEFIITPEDTALVTAYDASQPLVVGHAQEIDLVTGDLLFDWASYPAVPVSDSYTETGGTGDYFHINSIDQFADGSGDLLVSSRATWTIYRISRQTGEIVWRLGGMQSDFVQSPGTTFAFQHDARVLPDGSGISLFDNASRPSPERVSWGKLIDLDEDAMIASLRQEFTNVSPRIDSPNQGNTQRLPSGGHLVMWGNNPYFTVFPPSTLVIPEAVLEGRLPAHMTSYRSFLFDWVGDPPLSEMALVVVPDSGDSYIAHVSWNGATEVASWEFLAASGEGDLRPLRLVPKKRFETVCRLTVSQPRVFEAIARSGDGAVLGQVRTRIF